jgi:hypothetical protein
VIVVIGVVVLSASAVRQGNVSCDAIGIGVTEVLRLDAD